MLKIEISSFENVKNHQKWKFRVLEISKIKYFQFWKQNQLNYMKFKRKNENYLKLAPRALDSPDPPAFARLLSSLPNKCVANPNWHCSLAKTLTMSSAIRWDKILLIGDLIPTGYFLIRISIYLAWTSDGICIWVSGTCNIMDK